MAQQRTFLIELPRAAHPLPPTQCAEDMRRGHREYRDQTGHRHRAPSAADPPRAAGRSQFRRRQSEPPPAPTHASEAEPPFLLRTPALRSHGCAADRFRAPCCAAFGACVKGVHVHVGRRADSTRSRDLSLRPPPVPISRRAPASHPLLAPNLLHCAAVAEPRTETSTRRGAKSSSLRHLPRTTYDVRRATMTRSRARLALEACGA